MNNSPAFNQDKTGKIDCTNPTDDGTDDKFSEDGACHPSLTSGPRTLVSADDEIVTGMYRNTFFYHEIS